MLTMKINDLGDVKVLRLAGRITLGDEATKLRAAVESQHDCRTVILDLAGVSEIDAAGLGTLVSVRTWAYANGKQLKLMNLTPLVEEVLELTRLKSAFDVCSVSEMLDLLCRAAHSPVAVHAFDFEEQHATA